ncbi:MAG: LolA family protein [Phycisphaerales bacterium]
MHGRRAGRVERTAMLAGVLVSTGSAVAQKAEPEQPRDPGGVVVAPPLHERPVMEPSGEFKTADELLRALESADADLVTLTATVVHDTESAFEGDRQTRIGTLKFRTDPREGKRPLRRFAVEFTRLHIGPRLEEEPKSFVFDGEWLAEFMPNAKLCLRRQVVAPGEDFDPLRIGEGPLPIPIGQPRGDILARFDVELVPPASGIMPEKPEDLPDEDRERLARVLKFASRDGMHQLRLTPRPDADENAGFAEIRLWYKRGLSGRLLPEMVRAVKAADDGDEGDMTTVQLLDVKINDGAGVGPEAFDTAIPEGWNGQAEAWREPVGGRGPKKK